MNQNIADLKPFEYTLSVLSGKWKMRILYALSTNEILRYSELKTKITGITHKMLSSQLKELEKDLLVERKVYNQIPPKVEYFLTDKGKSLIPLLSMMCHWGQENGRVDKKHLKKGQCM